MATLNYFICYFEGKSNLANTHNENIFSGISMKFLLYIFKLHY